MVNRFVGGKWGLPWPSSLRVLFIDVTAFKSVLPKSMWSVVHQCPQFAIAHHGIIFLLFNYSLLHVALPGHFPASPIPGMATQAFVVNSDGELAVITNVTRFLGCQSGAERVASAIDTKFNLYSKFCFCEETPFSKFFSKFELVFQHYSTCFQQHMHNKQEGMNIAALVCFGLSTAH